MAERGYREWVGVGEFWRLELGFSPPFFLLTSRQVNKHHLIDMHVLF